MVKDASDYGALNVHMRAKRMELLTARDYNILASSNDLENLKQHISTTLYKNALDKVLNKQYPNLVEIDQSLIQQFVDQYYQYKRYVPKRSISFIEAQSMLYFLNNVKIILAALHSLEKTSEVKNMLISLSFKDEKEVEYLFGSLNIEDLIHRLKNPDLKEALELALGEYRYLNLIYPLTNAIDQYFYKNLNKRMSTLKGDDVLKVKLVYGTMIDLQNIEIILRSKFFKISHELIKKWLIVTSFSTLNKIFLESLIDLQDLVETIKIIAEKTQYRDLALRLLDNISQKKPALENFDHFTEQILVHKAHSIFRAASLNIGVFLAYFILKEIEVRNIRTIILGKIDKRPINEILDKLVLV